ncbi:alpha/beta-type small acid-soluble spore protein [Garciella nitratireducens]|uniref:Small, acid-soluble spore protein, alpha/beta type n=1 Tax=Garciella nitratireducens DSM 15102 TaxID=1121911 RepID=A0A1T4KPF2_9FIRM|nr:alpha/beta-type small acid-soluble spore protein [Garciella nitratireducens]RBP40264.1 small acid-soluble spore protein alpha/beta type [Garciella nitratireducens]SJZ44295.1 Small, acid-soluble spore protein, alpha/beta type [Garciella nitratireducens DSM 15102]
MSKRPLVPEAKEALDKMKVEFANEMGLQFSDKAKGNQPSRLNGATGGPIGGLMTKKMVEEFEKKLINK